MRDAEVRALGGRSSVALLALVATAVVACQSANKGAQPIKPPSPTPTIPPLTAADRAVIDQVKASLPPAERPCVAYVRAAPGTDGYGYLPNGLAVVYDTKGELDAVNRRNGTALLYYDGRVDIKSNTIYWPDEDEDNLPSNDVQDFSKKWCGAPIASKLTSADRNIIAKVQTSLPHGLRSHVGWVRVMPGYAGSGYDLLPNNGLIVLFNPPGMTDSTTPRYVLYYAGTVQTDSNVVYGPFLGKYLTAVTEDFRAAYPTVDPPEASPSPRFWKSDESTLDPVGRAIIAEVRAKMPAPVRKCVVWTRVSPGKVGYDELPDHGLIVMFHFPHEDPTADSHPGYPVLYLNGEVLIETSTVHIPDWDTYVTSTMQTWNFGTLGKNDYSDCLS